MAEAGEECGKSSGLEDELSCPICLSLYEDPASLSCGHSFCRQCIQEALSAQQQSNASYSCPVCKLQLGPILELQKNFQLCNIVEAFLATASKGQQGGSSAEGKKEVVPCDFCLDLPLPAVKTCLICDASLCEAHVNKHNAKDSQQDHILVEVGAGSRAEERKCQEHGRMLECYCQDDGQCICMLCSIAGCHKGHSIISLKDAHEKQLGELWKTVRKLQRYRSAATAALEELQKNEDQLKNNLKMVSSEVQKLFEEIKSEIIQKEEKLLSDIQSMEKEQLAKVTKVKKKMQQRRDKAAQHLQSLQKMREQTDRFLFFKEFKLAKDRIASQNFHEDFCTNEMYVVVAELDQGTTDSSRHFMKDCLSRLDPLMYGILEKLNSQIKWNSEASDTGTSSNYETNKNAASGRSSQTLQQAEIFRNSPENSPVFILLEKLRLLQQNSAARRDHGRVPTN